MAAPGPRNTNVRLLACLVDEEDTDDSDYRFLCNEQHVKYVTTAPGTFSGTEDEDNRTFEPILLGKLLPPFPPGDWNKGHVAKNPQTGEVAFVKTETVSLGGVQNLWHSVRLNELDFTRQDRVKQRVHVSTHPRLNNGEPVLVKLAVWPWEINSLEVETAAYQAMHEAGIGPRFLGHLTEGTDGRVIGFVAEWVQGARPAGPQDVERCKKALGRLHGLGIKFGDVHRHHILVRDGHDVVLVDFETAKLDCSPEELEDEMKAVESSLEDAGRQEGVE